MSDTELIASISNSSTFYENSIQNISLMFYFLSMQPYCGVYVISDHMKLWVTETLFLCQILDFRASFSTLGRIRAADHVRDFFGI